MTEVTAKKLILIFSTVLFAIYLVSNVKADTANFTVIMNSNDPFPGDIINFTLNVTNTGTLTLNPVQVVFVLPLGLTWNDSASPIQSSISNQTIIWNNIGPITSGSSSYVSFNASVDINAKPGNLTVYVNVTATYNFNGIHTISQVIAHNVTIERRPIFLTPALSPIGFAIMVSVMMVIGIVYSSSLKKPSD